MLYETFSAPRSQDNHHASLSNPNERSRICIWRLQFLTDSFNAPLEHLQLLQRAPRKRSSLRAPTQCLVHLHWREPAHSCVGHYATSQGACFLFFFLSHHFVFIWRVKHSVRQITPRHPSATSIPKQGGSAPTRPYNSRMISAARQSRTTPRRPMATHSHLRSGPGRAKSGSLLPVDSPMPRSTER